MNTNAALEWVPEPLPFATFGQRLRATRLQLGLPVTVIARACGVPPVTWRNWEAGRTVTTRNTEIADKLWRLYGVDRMWLVFGPVTPHAEHMPAPRGGYLQVSDAPDTNNPGVA